MNERYKLPVNSLYQTRMSSIKIQIKSSTY